MNIPEAIVLSIFILSVAAISITLVIYNQFFLAGMVPVVCYGLMMAKMRLRRDV
jgi:hypothetical protein